MAVRTQHSTTERLWFVTFTCYNWLPLFELTQSYHLVYNWLQLIKQKYGVQHCGFVIMPNHVHLVLYLPDDSASLNTVISNGKRFMAYELVKRLQATNQPILAQLTKACSTKEKAKGQLHKVFEPSFDAKPVYSLPFLHQKLDYIHHNPISGKWNLCDVYTNYPHSSAAYYVDGLPHEQAALTDYRDLDDWG